MNTLILALIVIGCVLIAISKILSKERMLEWRINQVNKALKSLIKDHGNILELVINEDAVFLRVIYPEDGKEDFQI